MPRSDYAAATITDKQLHPRQNKNRRRFAAALMVTGILVITLPFLTEVYGYFVQYRLKLDWESQVAKQEQEADRSLRGDGSRKSAAAAEDTILSGAFKRLAGSGTDDLPPTKIRIPRIGVEQVVLSGVGPDVLKNGPGHYSGTPLPGQRGNIGIAGHRVTYTHPFERLDELSSGDKVILETLDTLYEYRVVSSRTLDPEDLTALMPTKDARVTLTTCTPKYSAKLRLDVQASLVNVEPRRKPTLFRRLVGRIAKPVEKPLPKNVLDLAVSQGQAAVAYRPDDADARIYLGMVYRNIGRYDDAAGQLNKAIELDKHRPNSYFELSLLYERAGQTTDAIDILNIATEMAPGFENTYYRLGTLYLDSNQGLKAVDILKKALALSPYSSDTHFYLGQAYERQGQLVEAKREYEEALRFVPDMFEAKAAIRRLNKTP